MIRKIGLLLMVVVVGLACSVSAAATPAPTIDTPTLIAVPSPTVTPRPETPFSCRVIAETLNVRTCASKSCNSGGDYSILNDLLTVQAISKDGDWYMVKEFGGNAWVRSSYCVRKDQ